MLGFKDGVGTTLQPELGTQLVYRLRPATRYPTREAGNDPSHSG